MIYINLGFPKTSSTNIQKNLYPKIKEINYIGRYYHKKNLKIFNQLNDYIENRKLFSKNSLNNLKRLFKELVKKNHTILLSSENWVIPYQKNNKTDKIEIVSQFEKLKRLRKFMNDINISYKIFIIDRDKSTLIKSLFATLQERIAKLFGHKNLEFKNFIDKFNQKDNDYENIKLFFDIINLKKIEKTLQKKIKIFNYNLIKNNPEKFLIHLSTFMNIKIDISLADKLRIKTRVSESKNGNYIVKKPNFLFKLIRLITPKKIKMLLKKYNFYSNASAIMSNDTAVSYDNKNLKSFLEKIHKN
jgi:hypothetical protein